MAHPLDDPKLYKRCFRFAMALVRGWQNREEEAQEIVHDGYILAIRFTHQWRQDEISWEQWVIRKVRDAWRKWIERRATLKRKMIRSMTDELIYDEEGNEVEPDIPVAPAQENILLLKELIAKRTHEQHSKLATEVGVENGEISLGNFYVELDGRNPSRWNNSASANRCKLDAGGRRAAVRRNICRKGKNRAGFGLIAA